jgi:HAD superfamily phosphoserine phosphatase-like hydrolase
MEETPLDDYSNHLDQVLELMLVPNTQGIYVLGCFGRYVTVYSQQVRALNLAWALYKKGALARNTRIAVVGGGAGGLTLAVAAARLGATVTLLEKLYAPMGLQRGSKKRFVHPHIYDWPAMEVETDYAELPILDWEADYAGAVADQVEAEWKKELHRYRDRIFAHWEVRDVSIVQPSAGDLTTITWNEPGKGPRVGEFNIIVLAVGFGREPDVSGSYRYWEDDRLDQMDDKRKICLVSGYGDGGLTDLMRLTIRDFRHDRIVRMFANDPESVKVGEELIKQEEQFRNDKDIHKLSDYYQKLSVPHVERLLKKRRRTDTDVYLTGHSLWDVYGPRASILNRFIVSQLARVGALIWLQGPITQFNKLSGNKFNVRFEKTGTRNHRYDILVVRHGPQPALQEDFPVTWQACQDLATRWRNMPQHLDPTRKRLPWGDDFDVSEPIVIESTSLAKDQFRLVAFDLDGTLLQGPEYIWSWKLVWSYLNYEDSVRAQLMAQYLNVYRHKRRGWYKQWCDEAANRFRKRKLKRSDFAEITKKLAPVDGLYEVIRVLKQKGIKLAIVSGGIDVFLEEKIPEFNELFDYVFINKFRFDKNGMFSGVDATSYDFEGKFTAIKEMCDLEGYDLQQVVFVGDGFNDEPVIGRVGKTIGFNTSGSGVLMAQNADVKILDKDLRSILPHIIEDEAPSRDVGN